MATKYKVTGVKVRFGSGFILALSDDQAETRPTQLKKTKKKGQYEVLSTVEFKQGEEIGVVKGDIPKSWWDTVEQVSAKERPEPSEFKMVHKGFGKWDVLDADDNPINTEPLTKEEAQKLLEAQDGEEDEDPEGGEEE
ncbi:MAG: hypothetical protein H6863_03910 [Rhodospirillales bacterium]|nr:hypothetical protein [Rhodospirillales bacterium]